MSLVNFLNLSLVEKSLKLNSISAKLIGANIHDLKNTFIIVFTEETYLNDLSDDDRLLRGLIFNEDTKEIYSRTYAVQYDVKIGDRYGRCIKFEDIPIGNDKIEITELIDGTLLRLSYIDGEWILSTNAKWNAHDSHWNNKKTFKELFDSSITSYFDLNVNYIYNFILCHPEQTIVVNYDRPMIYHVDTLDKSGLSIENIKLDAFKYPITYDFSITEAYKNAQDPNCNIAGYMIIKTDANGSKSRYRMETISYIKAKSVVGKTPINQQMITLILEGNRDNINQFLGYYPNHAVQFNELAWKMSSFSKYVYDIYVNLYIKKVQMTVENRELKNLLMYIHKIYTNKLKSKKKHITFELVDNIVTNTKPFYICKMLDEYYPATEISLEEIKIQ